MLEPELLSCYQGMKHERLLVRSTATANTMV